MKLPWRFIERLFNRAMSDCRVSIMRPYVVSYPVSFGCMTINEEEYRCFAFCKYHAYLQFIEATKCEHNHYSARENRTPFTYSIWKEDVKTDFKYGIQS